MGPFFGPSVGGEWTGRPWVAVLVEQVAGDPAAAGDCLERGATGGPTPALGDRAAMKDTGSRQPRPIPATVPPLRQWAFMAKVRPCSLNYFEI